MLPEIFFIIEHGNPYQDGATLYFEASELLIGRSWEHYHPDLAFTNLCISRRHALVTYRDECFYLTDLGSKHGTTLNDQGLPAHKLFPLKQGDRISLARGMASLVFYNPNVPDSGDTVELSATESRKSAGSGLVIMPERRQIISDNTPIPLMGKDLDLLLLLYENRNRPVSYDEIKMCIWPERIQDSLAGVPDVGKEEIIALVYRLRKRLGKYGGLITAVPRYGYLLEIIS